MSKVYVFCPYGLVTGGPDALHQMVFYLNRENIEAHIVYCDIGRRGKPIPAPYKTYVDSYLLPQDIVDEREATIVAPETLAELLNRFSKAQKFVWWLSVQNDVKSGVGDKIGRAVRILVNPKQWKKLFRMRTIIQTLTHRKNNFSDKTVRHLCASYYAKDYVQSNGCTAELMIEPISLYFLNHYRSEDVRNPIVLFNPKKNASFSKKIIHAAPDIKFVPLKGYSQSELITLYSTSMVYMDFGFFPGAERIPKEAVLCGCCVVTGRYGASAYKEDVVIDEKYKIDANEANIPQIVALLKDCLQNYASRRGDFERYRETVLSLEGTFVSRLREVFGENQ